MNEPDFGEVEATPDYVKVPVDEYDFLKRTLLEQDETIARLLSQPLVYATVVKSNNKFDLKAYVKGDRVFVLDEKLVKEKRFYGKIASNGADKNGFLTVEYPDGAKASLNVGLNGNPQVKLLGKDDGTNVVISIDSKLLEVHGLPGKKINVGNTVKVNIETRQIHDIAEFSPAGEVALVKGSVDPEHIEVNGINGVSKVVIKALDQEIETGDRVMLDMTGTICVRSLGKESKDRYNLAEKCEITWNDIAGLEDAKAQLIEIIETPYTRPDVYKFYNQPLPKGVLLYGPPGCGKTRIAMAVANSMAKIHGNANYQSGFIHVKGPELLTKWVGDTEAEIRALFATGREHYRKHGYPATMFIDEGDAILPTRGSGKSSDVEKTSVPMFLSEMDGMASTNMLILIATNQPRSLDPAVTREGRIDRHIKISRPNKNNIGQYVKVHMAKRPLQKGLYVDDIVDVIASEIYSDKFNICKITHQDNTFLFGMKDIVTGAMVSGLVSQATSIAMKRDLSSKSGANTGLSVRDFEQSIQTVFKQHLDQNMSFDLEEYCEERKINKAKATFSKI